MTSSRSKASRSNRAATWIASVVLVMLWLAGTAEAQRKRVVVLDFEGDKAEKFHADVVKVIKKSHTVVAAEKWTEKAQAMSAKKATDANVKKVAKKMKIDGVITGTVEKRRSEYIVRLKLRAGVSGVVVNQTQIKADGPKLDKTAQGELKDELVEAIASLKANRGGGGDDDDDEEDEAPKKSKFGKKKKAADDEEDDEDEKPKKLSKKEEAAAKKKAAEDKKRAEEEERAAKKKAAEDEKAAKLAAKDKKKKKKVEEEPEEEDDAPLPKAKAKKRPKKADDDDDDKKVASSDDGDEVEDSFEPGEKMDAALALSPGQRAVDVVLGVSFNRRTMSFVHEAALVDNQRPQGYRMGVPVAGALLDLTLYPLAIGHKRTDIKKNIGLTVMYDRVLIINSKDVMNNVLDTSSSRFAVGGVFRYPFGKSASAPVIGASVRYGKQAFTIAGATGIPDVNYSILDPQLFFHYPASDKLIINAKVGYMAILDTGAMTRGDAYGPATVSGFEGEAGADYLLTKAIFARAAFRFETIGYKFTGMGALRERDNDPEPDVFGARDTYLGGLITIGYLY